MEYEKILNEYIQMLATTEDSVMIIKKAFAAVAEKYHIGELRSSLVVPPTFTTRNGEDRVDILYTSGHEIESDAGYTITYTTGEKGVASFYVYRFRGESPFTDVEKNELKPYLDALFLHFGRYRVINSIKQMQMTDALTGLLNSGGFIRYIDDLYEAKELSQYNAFYFNLARFSLINKQFGEKETDRIVVRYVKELVTFLQEKECVGRLGGDNFVALIKKSRTYDFINFISGIETYGMHDGEKTPVTISAIAGVLEIDDNIDNGGSVITDCGMALTIAKHVLKKPYVFASPEIKARMYREKQYESRFTDALRRREFKAYYQPKVNTEEYRIVGAEALVRWEHNGRLVSPAEFIPLFERNGMICKLDFYMLEQVCMDIREWLQMGIDPGRVSVNLSRRHLTNTNLAEDIMNILRKYEIESRYIEIELTETVDARETELLVAFVKNMQKYNILMSIDDFGTGYSSLNLLRSFPVDVLKIDKSFIDTVGDVDRIILSNIIRIAKELKMDVVAEGVETVEQMKRLRDMNCKIVQGYLFDRPMPKEEYVQKLIQRVYDSVRFE